MSWVRFVEDAFHARFSATARHYEYRILNRLNRSALQRRRAWWVHRPLDETHMHEAAQHLLGEHDFSAFRAAGCQASTPVREVTSVSVCRDRDRVTVSITANAFLQHMVRNITGSLVEIGAGERSAAWLGDVLRNRDRRTAGPAAPPHGLTFVTVDYPPQFGIPAQARA